MQVDNLPRPPTPVFEGRDTAITVLGRALAADSGVPVTQAVYGTGGVGKSELALHHAHAHRGDYQLMWWITAADSQQVEAGLANLAGRLCPPVALAGSTQEAAAWALDWLQGHDRWLLILDNVDDPEDVAGLLGQLRSGHIVLTTRREMDWRLGAAPIRLDVLGSEPAAQIITARTGHGSEQDLADAGAVAAELGFLPLALEQAAAYMIQARIRPGLYLDQLRRRQPGRTYAATAGRAQQTIARLWDVTTEAIGRPRSRCGQIAADSGLLCARQHSSRHPRRTRRHRADRRAARPARLLQHDHPHRRHGQHPPAGPGRRARQAACARARSRRHGAGMARRRDSPRPRCRRDRLAAATRPGTAH